MQIEYTFSKILYIYIYMILYNISRSHLEFPIAWNFKLYYPPRLASSQAVWPWLDPTRGHCRHVATGSKFGSIRILSIIAYSCQIPCQASFHPHVYIYIYTYIYIYIFVPGSGSPLPPTHGHGTPLPRGMGGMRVWYPFPLWCGVGAWGTLNMK